MDEIYLEDENSDAENSDDCLKIDVDSPQNKKKFKSLDIDDNDKEIIKSVENEFEKILEEKAAKANLTTCNVKNILKHVVTNEHVIAMVRQVEDPEISETLPVYEPKLTRAKAKELYSTHSTPIPWISTPKPPSEVQVLISEDLQEDSSGDEYVPAEEESEDDKDNASVSETSSVGPPTPKNSDSATQTNWSEDGIFKIPPVKKNDAAEEANIARRTRSKFSLSSTPLEVIEEAFIPPDITTDMYDMDCDDDDWRDFLKEFTRPLDEVTKAEDEDHDPEYNILADEEIDKVDKEELRADKGVKVTRKELNKLIAELFEYADNFSTQSQNLNSTVLDPQPQFTVLESENILTQDDGTTVELAEEKEDEYIMIENDQKLLLEQQMRQHVQLLTQNFLLCYSHSEYSDISAKCKEYLINLKLLPGSKQNSYFHATNLDTAVKLVEYWEEKFQSNDEEVQATKNYVAKVLHEIVQSKTAGIEYIPTFPPLILQTISNSNVFLYPHLLPRIPFKPTRVLSNRGFLNSENELLALGLEQFVPFLQEDKHHINSKGEVPLKHVCYYIQKYMVPIKDASKVYKYVCDCKYTKCNSNAVVYYFEHKKAPITTHFVVDLNDFGNLPPCQRGIDTLPYQWQQFIYPPQNIPTFITLCAVPNNITKVLKPPVYNKSFVNRRQILPKTKNIALKKKTKRKFKFEQKDTLSSNSLNGTNYMLTKVQKTKKLEHYFSSPVISEKSLHVHNTNLKRYKFNSNILKNLLQSETETMLPSMPSLNTPCKRSPERSESPKTVEVPIKTTLNNSENVEANEIEDEEPQKDNIEDINALMVASSTITTANKKKLSCAEKKKAKLRKDFSASLSMLSQESKNALEEKTNLYVQAFYDKLQEKLDMHDYHRLMEILNEFDEDKDSVSVLYENVNKILHPKYPDLTDEFLTFLTSAQAKAVGKLIPHLILTNMSLFLRKLEMYFKDQPTQVRKIYRCLTELSECVDVTIDKVKSTILPLLKGNSLLIDWFLQIFPCEKPSNSLLNGVWDTMDIVRDGTISHENIFETIAVPNVEDPYGGPNCVCSCHNVDDHSFKNRSRHCIPCGTKFLQGRVYVQTHKGLRLAKVTFNDSPNVDHNARLGCKSAIQKRKSEANSSKQVISPNKDSQDEIRASNSEEETDCARKKRQKKLVKKPRNRKPKQKIEKSNNENKSKQTLSSDQGNSKSLTNNLIEIAIESKQRDKEESSLDSNLNKQKSFNEGVVEWDYNTSIESIQLKLSPEHSAESASEETSQDNLNSDSDESSNDTRSTNSDHSDNSNTSEGQSWTRDEDKVILETFQKEGDKEETFLHIFKLLENRSIAKIKHRLKTLIKLIQEMDSNAS